jgi:hypothetical protein
MSGERLTGVIKEKIVKTTPRHSLKSRFVLGAVVVAAGAAFVVPTVAQAATTDTSGTTDTTTGTRELPARYQRACLRIPNLEIRTTNFINRLNGDATVRGSLAWLQTQIDDATAKGRTQLVTVLKNRLAVRTQTLQVLTVRQQRLEKLADKCRNHGVDI